MKEVVWSEFYGQGTVKCTCDNCSGEESFEFEDNNPDFKSVQKELRNLGWTSCKIEGKWYDFCCDKCKDDFIKKY